MEEVIKKAVSAAIARELQGVEGKLAHLRKTLDAFEEISRVEVERRVVNAVLMSLGQEVPLDGVGARMAACCEDMQLALWEVEELIAGRDLDHGARASRVQPAVSPEVKVEPQELQAAAASVVEAELKSGKSSFSDVSEAAVAPTRAPMSPSDIAVAVADMQEQIASGKLTAKNGGFDWIQALVAEVCLFRASRPEGDVQAERLGGMLSTLSRIKRQLGVSQYVEGLAFGAKGDWVALADVSWVSFHRSGYWQKYGASEVASSTSALMPMILHTKVGGDYGWPKLERLRQLIEEKPLVSIGGVPVPDKIRLCQDRFGVTLEWVTSSESLAKRVRAGTVGAVILFHSLLSHGESGRVIEACKAAGVRYALADRGGIAAIGTALAELDRAPEAA